jgi:hypothetical protein
MNVGIFVSSLSFGYKQTNRKRDLANARAVYLSSLASLCGKDVKDLDLILQRARKREYIQYRVNYMSLFHVKSGWILDVADADWLDLSSSRPPIIPMIGNWHLHAQEQGCLQ